MIAVDGLAVSLGTFRLSDVSFAIPAGAHAVLKGPNGTGKTTTLEAVCGLKRLDRGTVWIDGRIVTDLPPRERSIGFVPQDGALFPHLTVRENVAFALKVRAWKLPAVQARVDELAEQLGLAHLLDRMPQGLSGGEKQRVALARALAARPAALLLDEPFSALDAASRETLRRLLQTVRATSGVTILHVTHDAADALALATMEIALPRPGAA